ncbi:pyridoxamine 5'-phosphate oxidase [Teladorsagia circumcincta]|uniref:Pyridoxine-5'-phosphate oxidase n=1 Tax=Teladorsagia circumcincta TaxID=45464 RepID=A0A2G9U0Z8_TELCI|nr:pyridoxamine 5'-phosphate oxidase [Teladorsagia circumcincta]
MADAPLDIHAWRAPYLNKEEPIIDESKLSTRDPFKLFDIWFKNVAAQKATSYEERNAVCFSTVGKDMRPSSRVVLLKAYGPDGFSFYTNYNSRKARDLQDNPYACMLFYWPVVDRQVRVEGKVSKLPQEAAVDYWKSRPLASRIGSKSSEQSSVVPNREFLVNKRKALEELADKEGEASITKPESWGGYLLSPDYFEFWQGQSDRLHDRLEFRKNGEDWTMRRLSP